MDQSTFDQQLITLTGEDGKSHLCNILGIFPFAGEEYALLAPVDEPNTGDAGFGSPVLMRLVCQGEQAIFQTIKSDEEFARVIAFIKEQARQMDEERAGGI